MRWFVFYKTYEYDSHTLEQFDDENLVIALLNKHAGNQDFEFTVVRGDEIKFEPVSVATQYRRK